VEPPKLAPNGRVRVHRELTARARFEKWVVEKHEGSKVEKIKTACAVLLMICGIWLFIKLLPPIAAEIKFDWNKFAVAFNFPVIGDGRTGPPPSSVAQTDTPAVFFPPPKQATEAATEQGQPSRPSNRKTTTVRPAPPTAPPSGVVFVPSFGAGSSAYRLRLADGIAPGKLLYQVKPVYPEVARSRRPDPRVALRAVVDANGRVIGAQVIRGDEVLSAAAIQAIRQWRYEPYRVAGKPVEVETRIDIDFSNLR
jgi:TonB family protein